MKFKFINAVLLIGACCLIGYGIFVFDNSKPARILPIFGEKNFESHNGKMDTTFHTIQKFCFTNQDGKEVTQNDFCNCVYVTDFFFTTCHSICPIMSTQMETLYQKFKGNLEVKFLSHTVDPEIDTIAQLKWYSLKHNADSKQWMFVTGKKAELYDMARKSYLLDAQEGDGGSDDFIHTQNFALIDKDKRIRGFYDGTDSLDIYQLSNDINLLLAEYHYLKR